MPTARSGRGAQAVSLVVGLLVLLSLGTASVAPSAWAQPVPTPSSGPVSPRGESAQPATVRADKHPTLDSQLLAAARAARGLAPAAASQGSIRRGLRLEGDRVRVVIETNNGAVSIAESFVERRYGNLVQALVPVAQLESLAAQPGVRRVRQPFRPVVAAIAGEEVGASGANAWQSAGFTGAGVKVAIIDLGFQDYTQRQASGDLPATGPGSLVTQNFGCTPGLENGEVHGSAVAEIVHEMAPGAELHLICVQTEVDLALAEAYARVQGIHIVNHSVGWFNTARGDGSGGPGTPDAIVADARANGILWVNAAGNQAQQHWSGNFSDTNGNGFHNFTPTDELNNVSIPGLTTICFVLKWDSWPVTSQDFDVFLTDSAGAIQFGSTNLQNGSQPPTEDLCITNDGFGTFSGAITIQRVSGATTPRLDLFMLQATPQYAVTAGSVAEPATSPHAMAVGAVCWEDNALEPYSSRGPNIAGLTKPDIAGQDGPSSGTYGPFIFASLGVPGHLGRGPHGGWCRRAGQASQPLIRSQSAPELPGGQGHRSRDRREGQQLRLGRSQHGRRPSRANADDDQYAYRDADGDGRSLPHRYAHTHADADHHAAAYGDPNVQPDSAEPRGGEQRRPDRRKIVELRRFLGCDEADRRHVGVRLVYGVRKHDEPVGHHRAREWRHLSDRPRAVEPGGYPG